MNAPHRRNFITLRSQVLDSLLDIIDVEDDDDGEDDHDIGFREFARVMTAADVFKMKALRRGRRRRTSTSASRPDRKHCNICVPAFLYRQLANLRLN